jgi:hypothetical protein
VLPAGQGASGGPPLLRIKWPNDLYFRGLKVGGALLHSTWRAPCFHLTTGIGLNVTNRQPTACVADILAAAAADGVSSSSSLHPGAEGGTTTSALPSSTQAEVGREEVLAEVMLQLEACLDVGAPLPACLCSLCCNGPVVLPTPAALGWAPPSARPLRVLFA